MKNLLDKMPVMLYYILQTFRGFPEKGFRGNFINIWKEG